MFLLIHLVCLCFKSKGSSSEGKEAAPETECDPDKTPTYVHKVLLDTGID